MVRYIHLNPIRARIVRTLAELNRYSYSGHSVLMGKKNRPWQDVDYVLSYFGKTPGRANKAYYSYVEAGLEQGRRKELTGGGLIRSLGGWVDVSRYGLKGQGHIKSDERILGESDFVDDILSQTSEKFERHYELKLLGYDLDRIALRVAEICEIEVNEIFLRGKQQQRVKARSLFCFWSVRELGISLTELARRLGILHFISSIAQCETQQWPILEPSPGKTTPCCGELRAKRKKRGDFFMESCFFSLPARRHFGRTRPLKGSNLLLALTYYFLYPRHLVSELLTF